MAGAKRRGLSSSIQLDKLSRPMPRAQWIDQIRVIIIYAPNGMGFPHIDLHVCCMYVRSINDESWINEDGEAKVFFLQSASIAQAFQTPGGVVVLVVFSKVYWRPNCEFPLLCGCRGTAWDQSMMGWFFLASSAQIFTCNSPQLCSRKM
ncbi:unnamed protein product [Cuscuta epithymum]|uniref:Uncharacterized protein n=1 Tax=Cuscuta epithymum TaxID=186058 RepID=A0AAV0ETY2_9ASTE|nr:unnamed protein product [Cuscuta epithymum]